MFFMSSKLTEFEFSGKGICNVLATLGLTLFLFAQHIIPGAEYQRNPLRNYSCRTETEKYLKEVLFSIDPTL